MLSKMAVLGTKKMAEKLCANFPDDNPNRIATEHVINAMDSYERMEFKAAYNSIQAACEIVNTRHDIDGRVRGLVAKMAARIQRP